MNDAICLPFSEGPKGEDGAAGEQIRPYRLDFRVGKIISAEKVGAMNTLNVCSPYQPHVSAC